MAKKTLGVFLLLWGFSMLGGGLCLLAQQTPPSEMVLYNGKIVTVDDGSNTSRIGTIGQEIGRASCRERV